MVIIVRGRPVSVNASAARRRAWMEVVAQAASAVYVAPLNDNNLRIIITFWYERLPDFDTDNISKPICDALQGIVYYNDHQLMERIARRKDINGRYHIRGAPPEIVLAIRDGVEFVSIQIERVGEEASRI